MKIGYPSRDYLRLAQDSSNLQLGLAQYVPTSHRIQCTGPLPAQEGNSGREIPRITMHIVLLILWSTPIPLRFFMLLFTIRISETRGRDLLISLSKESASYIDKIPSLLN